MHSDPDSIGSQIRRRPGMYVGDTGMFGRSSLVELLLMLGFVAARDGGAREISVSLRTDGSCRFCVGLWPWKLSGGASFAQLETWLAPTAAFVEMDGDLGTLCALSSPLDVIAWTEDDTWCRRYREGLVEQTLADDTTPRASKSGLCITFTPDASLFEAPPCFDVPRLRERIEALSAFHPGVTWTLRDEATGTEARFLREEGLADLCRDLSPSPLGPWNPLSFEAEVGTTKLRLALVWTEGPGRGLMSWANLFSRNDTGPHRVGFRQGMREALSACLRRRGAGARAQRFDATALFAHLTAVLDIQVEKTDWYLLTRERVASEEVQATVARLVAQWVEQALAADPRLEVFVLKLAGLPAR
ncbi:DNA gyrase subunit B [Myxococcus sp. K38C18041901]|uniref:DNA gyrase subunit B n=1 Tax=Myxococcus guangdongensis TaxID=2906760 RepID=UPI0020A7ACF9|nr:DNA gyrase subunit B [Myxococcus guangdongensis]MCP3062874.1 DNA gyrase subunit B [Myxococcus guangdongensis]